MKIKKLQNLQRNLTCCQEFDLYFVRKELNANNNKGIVTQESYNWQDVKMFLRMEEYCTYGLNILRKGVKINLINKIKECKKVIHYDYIALHIPDIDQQGYVLQTQNVGVGYGS